MYSVLVSKLSHYLSCTVNADVQINWAWRTATAKDNYGMCPFSIHPCQLVMVYHTCVCLHCKCVSVCIHALIKDLDYRKTFYTKNTLLSNKCPVLYT